MPGCSYINCGSHSAKKRSDDNEVISFHRIPKEENIREVWLARIGRTKYDTRNLSTNARFVCSKHFHKHHLFRLSNQTYLKKDSLSTQFEETKPIELYSDFQENISFTFEESINSIPFTGKSIEYNDTVSDMLIPLHRDISKEHNYTKPAYFAPRKRVLSERLKISKLRTTIRQLRRQVNAAEKLANRKYSKFKNFDKLTDFVQGFIETLLKHFQKKSHPKRYSAQIRQFALTLHYYSPTAYEYVRELFLNCLPCCQTIRNWYCTIDGSPGFSSEALLALQNLQFETPYPIVGCLLVDGMSVRKHLQNDGNTTFGYVNYGGVIPSDKRSIAKEALNVMFVGMNISIKICIGYFLINGITGQQQAHLIEVGTQLLRDCGLIAGTFAFDGLPANFSTANYLGVNYSNISSIKSTIEIGNCPYKMFAWPDMSHMITLFRNALHDLGTMFNEKNEKIEWKYFVKLFDFQKTIGLRISNKLTKLHLYYKNQIMKVYLATQLFSTSVAGAIQICDKTFNLPDFKGSAPTVECIRIINDLFDIFNTFDMTKSSYKQPLHRENFEFISGRLDVAKNFLLHLKDISGLFMYKSSRNTCIVGMLMLIESLKGFYAEYVVETKLLTYVPTYKASQDNLEIFHCQMRAHSGFNTNPTPIQYKSAFKKSLIHVQVCTKSTSNCIAQENIPILSVNSTRVPRPFVEEFIKELDYSELELDGILPNVLQNYGINEHYLYEYVNIIAYISGFVARRLTCILKCEFCISALITTDDSDPEFVIIHGKQKGGLILPSRSVREVCAVADITFRYFLKESGGKMLNVEFNITKMTLVVGKYCSENKTLFDDLDSHFRSSPSDFHYYILIREIAILYLKVRVHYLNKTLSGNDGTRQKKTHEVHFLGM